MERSSARQLRVECSTVKMPRPVIRALWRKRPKAPANNRRPPLPGIQLKAPKVALGRLFSRASIPVPPAIGFLSPLMRREAIASHRRSGSYQRGVRARNGRHAAWLSLPKELGVVGRQLRPLHRYLQQWPRRRLHPATLRGNRRKARLQNASGRLEGLLLPDLRHAIRAMPYAVTFTVDLRSRLPQLTSGPITAVNSAFSTTQYMSCR